MCQKNKYENKVKVEAVNVAATNVASSSCSCVAPVRTPTERSKKIWCGFQKMAIKDVLLLDYSKYTEVHQ